MRIWQRGMVGLGLLMASLIAPRVTESAEPVAKGLFARKNLVAWCIVPFDSKKRGPEERAAMLQKLGFTHFAYDYRAEHIPTFDAELEALKRHGVELTAWWFPTSLNDEARLTLDLFARHKVTPQLWVTGGGGPAKDADDQRARVTTEAQRIRPIAEAASRVGCKVALYNHGGWFGEPENQIAIIKELALPNVGIVYNLHHGHDHLDRFPELLRLMKPHLYCLNLNGMVAQGDRHGQKILQLGEGDLDLKLLTAIRDSGFTGPFGILGHTQDDAEARLQDNLEGLDWLIPQVSGLPAGPKPRMRTPVPQRAAAAPAVPAAPVAPLADGKFGKALQGRSGGALVAGQEGFREFPITVECWTRLAEKDPYQILVAHELKSSGTHWEVFTMAGSGTLTAYCPGFSPDHCRSSAMICDSQWHHVAMILEPARIRLFLDGKCVADQAHKRTALASVAGPLGLATLVDRAIGCTGLVDEVRLSRGVREIQLPTAPFAPDAATLGLWHLDAIVEQKRLDDASAKPTPALLGAATPVAPGAARPGKIEGHWGEDAIGFRWTEADSRDDRLSRIESGPFFSGSITGPGGPVWKGIVVRVGPQREAAICYDTELLRAACGWTGYLKFDPARFGVIVPPRVEGETVFSTQRFPGVSLSEAFPNFRETQPYGPLPRQVAHYRGLYRHGARVVLEYSVGPEDANTGTVIRESPWWETQGSARCITRTFEVQPGTLPIRMQLGESTARVGLHASSTGARLESHPGLGHLLVIPPRSETTTIKALILGAGTSDAAIEKLIAASPAPESIASLAQPGPAQWGAPLVTRGELGTPEPGAQDAYVVDTLTLPFDNPYRALLFCGGHDFLPDGRAVMCTMHGDVWLVGGIDATLEKLTWQRFATGLFQPLGIRVRTVAGLPEIYVVGRDQITRLIDHNGDGEADQYLNFNNDAQVTLNGHEYVTCLETDRNGNFYYIKGNCNSQTSHDGCLLRVTGDGGRLDVVATGFRNSNGIGMGPGDEITVAPQEGEWTPASGVFLVREGGFYGGMMSHHRPVPPTDFERPLVWFPRLADNSSGGQVWTTSDRFGPLSQQLLHMSYGQCRLRLVLQEAVPGAFVGNGASIELPLRFLSGIHRGRMSPHDGQLYLTGLKGWTTSAVHDGCFQRVRWTGRPLSLPTGFQTAKNGVALKFSQPLDRVAAEDPANWQAEAWNYRWSAAYGSPEFRPSQSGQVGRDEWAVRSATLQPDGQTVFLELADLRPVDQLQLNYTVLTREGRTLEQSLIMTLKELVQPAVPDLDLHRPRVDPDWEKFVSTLTPGVEIVSPQGDRHRRRMFAWTGLPGQATGGPATWTATAWLKVPVTAQYQFSLSEDSAPAMLQIGNHPSVALPRGGLSMALSRGIHPITVTQSVAAGSASTLRLLWESPRFPREAIPATVLGSPPAETTVSALRDRGAWLADRMHCRNCHQLPTDQAGLSAVPGSATFPASYPAPRLDGVGDRLHASWMTDWITNPRHLRPDATMPAMVASDDRQAAADLTAYLGTLRGAGATRDSQGETPTEEGVRAGEALFEQLGCVGCHTWTPAATLDPWNRVSLQAASSKFRPGALQSFLSKPHEHDPQRRMPDFHLSPEEASHLAQFIRQRGQGVSPPLADLPAGDATRGRTAFTTLQCNRCHAIDTAPLPGPTVRAWKSDVTAVGCLGAERSGGRPSYGLTADDAAAVMAWMAAPTPVVLSAETMIQGLRCQACHARDARPGWLPEIIAEEGSGRPPESIPHLTWVGEKLQGPWIASFVAGRVAEKPRPWLKARMPAFPGMAPALAAALAVEHGVPFVEPPPQTDAARVEVGYHLTLREGLDCRQCHGVGSEQPRGDASTQIALGINFSQTRSRLRPEFALRQMLDPPRYDPGSRMPRFAPDLKSTAVKHVEQGDARRQFERVKEYLWSLPESASTKNP